MSTIDATSPLYLHPSDGNNFMIIDKLQGSSNYRSWKRSMEIALSSKRKLGFVTGSITRDATDSVKGEAWDTCNNMIISWIFGSVSESIKKSIMFVSSAHQIWNNLEQRFALTNGSRKYKLNKDLYEVKQQGKQISEYYTQMRALWEELESLNILPAVTTMTPEITNLISALTQQKEEQKLFQFLNGLDEVYGPQRSQLLMMVVLPSVETACSYLEQEEAQREILGHTKEDTETSAMFSKSTGGVTGAAQSLSSVQCTACGKTGHSGDKCWSVVGYPSWHPKAKPQNQGTFKGKGRMSNNQQKWNKGRGGGSGYRVAANVQGQYHSDAGSVSSSIAPITAQQLEQLLRMLPASTKGGETDDEIEQNYAGMVSCHFADSVKNNEWILDSGASDHMTGFFSSLDNVSVCNNNPLINLPTGETSKISHSGNVSLKNDLRLKHVLYIPAFKQNLLSVNKLCQDNAYKVVFYDNYCIIHDNKSNEVKGIGRSEHGLYYLINEPIDLTLKRIKDQTLKLVRHERKSDKKAMAVSSCKEIPTVLKDVPSLSKETLWHHRLGHAPMKRIMLIKKLGLMKECTDLCLTCPLAKFTKLSFTSSESKASRPFELIHIDTWGPYKVNYRGKFKYFLTIVDDYSRVTWIIFFN